MSELVTKAESYVKNLLETELDPNRVYHDWKHTQQVVREAVDLAQQAKLNDEDLELLQLAALFHDTGFVRSGDNHENISKAIAGEFLQKENLSQDKIDKVNQIIEATRMPHISNGQLGSILQDADLASLAKPDWEERSELLRKELAYFDKIEYSNADWIKHNNQFFKSTSYHTPEAKLKYDEAKERNRDEIKARSKESKRGEGIGANRTAEMLFKTAMRNNIKLTQIADNKAHIMLTICSLILTFAIPSLANKNIFKMYYFIIPAVWLGLTCVVAIVYATLSTQPGKMVGKFKLDDIAAGKGSLFFFGNFYNNTLKEYTEGMKIMLSNINHLDDSAILDMYFTGKSLGRKFNLLSKCYSTFLLGIVSAPILTAILYLSSLSNHSETVSKKHSNDTTTVVTQTQKNKDGD